MVANGHVLIDVRLMSEGSTMSLPVEVFDGESFIEILRQLENEWHSALIEPLIESKDSKLSQLDNFNEQYLIHNQDRIKDLHELIQQIENLLIWPSQNKGVSERINRLNLRHKSALMLYQKQLVRAYLVQDRVQHRIESVRWWVSLSDTLLRGYLSKFVGLRTLPSG